MKGYIRLIADELFKMLAVALVVFVLLETVKSGIVLAYININFVLILWFIIGIVVMLLGTDKQDD